MKQLQKTEELVGDPVVDRLLRAKARKQARTTGVCPVFDPDRVNAYVERVLTEQERDRFEAHLGSCAPCRSAVGTLARLARDGAAPALARPAVEARGAGLGDGVRSFGKILMGPEWALAATAVVMLAIGLPIYFSRTSERSRVATSSGEFAAQPPPSGMASDSASPNREVARAQT